jgi:predicted oxidoreductase (fatty acid repression mutant protein)
MERSFKQALEHRRTFYGIGKESLMSEKVVEDLVKFAVKHVPSAFNSQSTRVVVLFGKNHLRLWSIVKETLRKIVPETAFEGTENKIDSFAAGYASLLFFEDESVVKSLQQQFPGYAANFPIWSQQTSGMHQLAIWTMLEDKGLGASLQHYNPLIDDEVHATWNIPQTWKLIAQMPFGKPISEPGEKTFSPLDERVLFFK